MRVFAALELPEDARAALARATERLADALPGVRWVRPENLHVTVKFLGEVEGDLLRLVQEALDHVTGAFDPFELELDGPGAFPDTRRPSVLVMKLAGDETAMERLRSLARRFEKSLSMLGFRPERRKFHPHVTLGRVRRGEKRKGRGNRRGNGVQSTGPALMRVLGGIEWPRAPVPVGEIVLFQSDLRPEGPLYIPLGRSPLGG